MARPADMSLQGTSGTNFGPAPSESFNLGEINVSTIHQLDVDGATANAKALADVFNKGGALAQKEIDKRAAARGDADQASGEVDAATGQVDEQRMQTASRYAVGVKRAGAQLAASEAADKARAFAAQNLNMSLHDTQDANGNNVPGLLSSVDGIFRGAFPGGQEKDPVVANMIAPIVQHTMNEITGKYYENQVIQGQQKVEDAQTAALRQSVMTGAFDANGVHMGGTAGIPFNLPHALESLSMVYDPKTARNALAHVVGQAAIDEGRPDIIDRLLPAGVQLNGNGATLSPENRAYLEDARNHALERKEHTDKIAANSYADKVVDYVLKGGDPMAMLHQYNGMPQASADQAIAIARFAYTTKKEGEEDAVENNKVYFRGLDGIHDGTLDNTGALTKFAVDNGLGNTKAGRVIIQRWRSELEATNSINRSDPDYATFYQGIHNMYQPKTGPMGSIMNPQAQLQQSGAQSDFNLLYNSEVRQGKSSRDAALEADKKTREKWGDPIEDSMGKVQPGQKMATPYGVKLEAIRGDLRSATGAAAFHASGATMRDINELTSVGAITTEQGELAARLIIAKHQP